MNEPAPKIDSKAPQATLMRLGDLMRAFGEDAEAAHIAKMTGVPRGPVSSFKTLDRELSGAWLPGLHWIHGNAGTGKTAFALQVAGTCKTPALFVSCEMAPVELLRRHTARTTNTYLGRLKSGELARPDAEKLAYQGVATAPDLALVDATRAAAPIQTLHDMTLITRGASSHVLIVIDSLHSWALRLASGLPEYEALNMAISDLQSLAHTLKCPILAISERNRDSMKTGGLNAGAGTRKIEYSGETVLDLHREQEAKEDGSGEVPVKLTLSKNRHGTAGKPIEMSFHGALQRFKEVTR